MLSCFIRVLLLETPWTLARQAPLSMEISQARILEWVVMPSSRGSSGPRDRTWVSYVCVGGSFPVAPPGKPMDLDKCLMTCIHHCSITQNSFTALNILCAPPAHPSSQILANQSFYCLCGFTFPECHMIRIIQYVEPFQIGFFHLVLCI